VILQRCNLSGSVDILFGTGSLTKNKQLECVDCTIACDVDFNLFCSRVAFDNCRFSGESSTRIRTACASFDGANGSIEFIDCQGKNIGWVDASESTDYRFVNSSLSGFEYAITSTALQTTSTQLLLHSSSLTASSAGGSVNFGSIGGQIACTSTFYNSVLGSSGGNVQISISEPGGTTAFNGTILTAGQDIDLQVTDDTHTMEFTLCYLNSKGVKPIYLYAPAGVAATNFEFSNCTIKSAVATALRFGVNPLIISSGGNNAKSGAIDPGVGGSVVSGTIW